MKSVPARSVSPLRARTSRRAPGIPCALVLVTVFALGGHIARADSQRDSSAAFAAPRLPSESEIESAASAEQQRIQRAAGPRNQVFLVSTRGIGSSRDVQRVSRGLQVESAVVTNQALGRWTAASLDDVLASDDPRMATVVFVHGNRVSPGTDKQLGEMVYRRLVTAQSASQPFRLIVWSWPASTIRGLIRDYRVKAARTDPAGWQLAWFLQRGNPRTPVGLIGYSYGARVVNGALQLLAGGRMRGMELPKRPTRRFLSF